MSAEVFSEAMGLIGEKYIMTQSFSFIPKVMYLLRSI